MEIVSMLVARTCLTASEAASIKEPGTHRVSENLYIRVVGKSRTWTLRWNDRGRAKSKSLGPVDKLPLTKAKQEARVLLTSAKSLSGTPKERVKIAFSEVAKLAIRELTAGRTPGSVRDWETSLLRVVNFGDRPIGSVTQDEIVAAIRPFWHTRPIKAKKLLYKVAKVFQWAKVAGYVNASPAIREELKLRLGRHKIVRGHYEAVQPEGAPGFYQKLRAYEERHRGDRLKAPPCHALMLIMLTACRADEIQLSEWPEYTGPRLVLEAERTKQRQPHEVPLSSEALRVLALVRAYRPGTSKLFAFTNPKLTLHLLRRLTKGRETVHGLRSTFATWAELEGFQDRTIERCLGHTDRNEVRRAYRRDGMLEARRELLEAWAGYLTGEKEEGSESRRRNERTKRESAKGMGRAAA